MALLRRGYWLLGAHRRQPDDIRLRQCHGGRRRQKSSRRATSRDRRGKSSPISKGLSRGRGDPLRHRQDHDVPNRPIQASPRYPKHRCDPKHWCGAACSPSDKAPDRSAPRHRLGLPVGEPRVWQQWPRPGVTGAKSSLETTAWEHPHVCYSAEKFKARLRSEPSAGHAPQATIGGSRSANAAARRYQVSIAAGTKR
jgi:hypothetical protein